jgi:ribokinase
MHIVVIGSSNTDLVTRGNMLPVPGQTIMHDHFMRAAGGKGANQAVAAARAGAQVSLIAAVGDDDFGQQALAGFGTDGIDCRHVRVLPGVASGVALILVDARGENMIAVAPGANACLHAADVQQAEQTIASASAVLASLEVPLEAVSRAAAIAHAAGVPFILNPAPAPGSPLPEPLLRQVSILTPNESEFAAIIAPAHWSTGMADAAGTGGTDDAGRTVDATGMADAASTVDAGRTVDATGTADTASTVDAGRKAGIRHLFDLGIKALIVTRGAQGISLYTPDSEQHSPALKVQAVDTVGAGDAFNGCLATALAEGRSLEQALRFAQAGAAIAVTRDGAQPGMAYRNEIDALLAQG